MPTHILLLFKENESKFQELNPHAYEALTAMTKITETELSVALMINSIADIVTFCTSIVARMQNGTIIHARNLDFDPPQLLNKLIYKALYKKNN